MTDEVDTVALPGDTNRDGIFNSTDLILAFQLESTKTQSPTTRFGRTATGTATVSSTQAISYLRSNAASTCATVFSERLRPGATDLRTNLPWDGSLNQVDLQQSV